MNHDPDDRQRCRLCGATYMLSNFGDSYLEDVGGDPRICIQCHEWVNRGMEPPDTTLRCPGCREKFDPTEGSFTAIHYHHWNKDKERITVCSRECKQKFERAGF